MFLAHSEMQRLTWLYSGSLLGETRAGFRQGTRNIAWGDQLKRIRFEVQGSWKSKTGDCGGYPDPLPRWRRSASGGLVLSLRVRRLKLQ
jgi:hypothetical protein